MQEHVKDPLRRPVHFYRGYSVFALEDGRAQITAHGQHVSHAASVEDALKAIDWILDGGDRPSKGRT